MIERAILAKLWPVVAGGALLLVLAAGGVGAWIGHGLGTAAGDSRAAKAELALSNAERHAAQQLALAEAKARAQELAHALALAAIGERYEQDKLDAQRKADAVVADLRAGNIRLHDRWQACSATRVPSTEPGPGELDASADDRSASAGRIIAAAAACEAQVRGLQDVVRADRQ